MKKLLISMVALLSILSSSLTLALVASGSASGQEPAALLNFVNTSSYNPAISLLGTQAPLLTPISVTVRTVGGCDAGNREPLKSGRFSLPMSETAGNPGETVLAGLLSTRCNWEISYSNLVCEVEVTVKDTAGDPIGSTVVTGLPIILSGTGNTSELRFRGSVVGSLEFSANLAGAGGLTIGSTSTTPGKRCATAFYSILELGGNALTAAHAGLEISATYASITDDPGCIGGVLTNRVTVEENGTVGLEYVSAVPAQGRIIEADDPRGNSGDLVNGVTLIKETIAQKADSRTPEDGDRCQYDVTVSDKLGNLRLARTSSGQIDSSLTTRRIDGFVTAGTADPTNAGSSADDTVPSIVTVTYVAYSVPVTVVATYPDDEVFTTEDSVYYAITLNAPCGGYNEVIPEGFGGQSDAASAQVFPGSLTIYGSALSSILEGTKTFTIPAYSDVAGTKPCSVTVTERSGIDRCPPVGGASQTLAVDSDTETLAFEFSHTCTTAGSDSGVATTEGSDAPPAPPSLSTPDNPLTSASSTTGGIVGPKPERNTG